MSEKGCLASDVAGVLMGSNALQMVAGWQSVNNQERWVVLRDGRQRHLLDFRGPDGQTMRQHIQQTDTTPSGLVVFLCLEDEHGSVVDGSQQSRADMRVCQTAVEEACRQTVGCPV
jgi:hypothetical protein